MYFYLLVLTFILIQPIFSQDCSIQGKCIFSNHIITVTASSVEQCLVKCAIDTKCKWSTYNLVNQHCLLYTNCLTIDDSYIDSKTNERECVNGK